MHCIFNCKNVLEADSFPICQMHTAKLGLELGLIEHKSLVQSPRGLGPFLSAVADQVLPKLYFKMGLPGTEGHIRSLYLPTFRKNHVIVHCLNFANFLGDRADCATIEPVQFDLLEKLKQTKGQDTYIDNVIQEQTDAQKIMTSVPPTDPKASNFLLRILNEYQSILRSSVFATITSRADVLRFTQEIFTINFPDFLTKMVSTNYAHFNIRNTVWSGLIYHLFPEKIKYQADFFIEMGHNCELKDEVGLVASNDIYPGQLLILKGKEIELSDLMCFLLPPNDTPFTGKKKK